MDNSDVAKNSILMTLGWWQFWNVGGNHYFGAVFLMLVTHLMQRIGHQHPKVITNTNRLLYSWSTSMLPILYIIRDTFTYVLTENVYL